MKHLDQRSKNSLNGAIAFVFVMLFSAGCSGTTQGPAVPVGGNPSALPVNPSLSLSYSNPSVIYTKDQIISNNTPTLSGATAIGYSVVPLLPAGISLDPSTGVISGTPTALSSVASFVVTALSALGSVSATINITVNDALAIVTFPTVAPTQISLTLNAGSGLPIAPVLSGGAVTGCTVSPALPAGLQISNTTCEISGSPLPSVLSTAATYTITPSNSGGAATPSQLVIAVNDASPGTITYSTPVPTHVKNSAITNNIPSVAGGGTILSWSISPNLNTNTGLTFSTLTGIISGTPTLVSSPGVAYTITATNSGGIATVAMTVIVNDFAPTISYLGPFSYQAGTVVAPVITPSLGGGIPTNCIASPALPSGFTLHPTSCVIAGTPTGVAAAQDYTINASNSGGSASGTVNLAVTAAAPGNIVLTGIANFTTSTCSVYTLTVRDSFGNPSNVSADTTFDLSGAGSGGAYYSDSMCTSVIMSATVMNGTSAAAFYYQKSAVGAATLTAILSLPVSPALGSATKNVNVSLSTPAKYGLVVPATGTTVSCNAVTINVLDSNNNPVNATSALTVTLAATGGGSTYYSDAGCTTTITTRAIGIGAGSAVAYFRRIQVGATPLTASSAGMGNGTGSITISLAPAARIVFNAAPAVPYPSSTCQTYALQTRDGLGNNNPNVAANTNVDLTGVSDGSFYSTATCTLGSEITFTTVTSGTAARTVYFKKPTATATVPGAAIVLTATVATWTPNGATTVTTSSGSQVNLRTANAAAGIAVSTATNVTAANRCLQTAVRVQDELNVLVPAANVLVPIVANLSGGGAGAQFWSNAACTTSTTTVTINAGANTGNFWYNNGSTTGGAVAMVWDNAGLGGTGSSRNVTVTSGVPSRLTWTTAPTSFAANTCQTYTFNVRDSNTVTALGANVGSDTVFQLSDGSDGTFFSGAGCVGSVSTITVLNGAQTATFRYRKLTPTPPAATLTASLNAPASPVITNLNQAITVTLAPDNVLISAAPAAGLIATQSCSSITLTSRNGVTPANVTANTTITLSATNGGTYYYDAGCTAAASPNTLTISSGTNTKSGLYIKTANTGNVTLSGTGALTVNNLVLTYAAPAPTQLALTGPILLTAGSSCGLYTATTQDSGGITRNVAAPTTITATSTGGVGVQFYSDASCTTALPSDQVTISTGTSSAGFYSAGPTIGSAQITITGGGLTADSQNVTVQ